MNKERCGTKISAKKCKYSVKQIDKSVARIPKRARENLCQEEKYTKKQKYFRHFCTLEKHYILKISIDKNTIYSYNSIR